MSREKLQRPRCPGLAWTVLAVALLASDALAQSADFDDLSLATESVWYGPDPNGAQRPGQFGGTETVGTFRSGSVQFVNRFNQDFGTWSGFAYSNRTDTTTAGFVNQFSALAGSGFGGGGDNYAVAFGNWNGQDPPDVSQLEELPYFELPDGARLQSAYVTNTTYAGLSMRNGDQFSKKFGGPSGDDPDWFKLTAYGTDAAGTLLAETVEFYLADYRFNDNSLDVVLDRWARVDFSPLAGAQRVYFNLTSSDVGDFGMNTPAYFAIDEVALVPEPSSLLLCSACVVAFLALSARRRSRLR